MLQDTVAMHSDTETTSVNDSFPLKPSYDYLFAGPNTQGALHIITTSFRPNLSPQDVIHFPDRKVTSDII